MKLSRSTAHRILPLDVAALALAYWRLDAAHRSRIADGKRQKIDRFLAELEIDRLLGASEQFELVPVEARL